LIKFLEASILDKINNYTCTRLNKNAIGFVPKCEIGMNVARGIRAALKAKNSPSNKKFSNNASMVFIDFSSAFDSIIRPILYSRIRNLKILNNDELQLLEHIHSRTRVRIGDNFSHPETGAPQGTLTAPGLFSIYLEPLLNLINKELPGITVLAYADDLCFVVSKEHDLPKLIKLLESWSINHNMTINKSKSLIMPLGRIYKHSIFKNKDSYLNYPIGTQYRFLGTYLDSNLTFDLARKTVSDKCKKLNGRLFIMNKRISIAERIFLYNIFICPQFDLLSQCIPFMSNSVHNKLLKDQLRFLKSSLLLRKRIDNRILDALNPLDFSNRHANNIHRVNQKLLNRFPLEPTDVNQKFQPSKTPLLNKKAYKDFKRNCNPDIFIQDKINQIGLFRCRICTNFQGPNNFPTNPERLTLEHINSHLAEPINSKASIFKDLMDKDKSRLLEFTMEFGIEENPR
jgi:hypothetical protein